MSFEAIILAAGAGNRLKSYTKNSPKPMLPVLGTPLLEHAVNSLRGSGINKITIAGHNNFSVIEDHFRISPAYAGADLNLVKMDRLRGTAYALKSLKDSSENVLVYYGDIVLNHDFPWRQFFQAHESGSADVTILYKRVADARTCGVLNLQGDQITGIREKPFLGFPEAVPGNINAAVYLLNRRAVERAVKLIRDVDDPANTKNDFMRNVFPQLLAEGFSLKGFDLGKGYWMSVDRPEQYRQIFLDYLRGKLRLEVARSYEDIDAAGSWGYKPFLRQLGENNLLPPFREYFSSAFRQAVQSRDKQFLDRLALLRNLLGDEDAHPAFFTMIKELRDSLKLTYQERMLFWRASIYRSFDLEPGAGTTRLDDIPGEAELLKRLRGGEKIIAYRALMDHVPLLPAGKILDEPPMERGADRELEDVRANNFPNIPSRQSSVFLAPSVGVAQRFGAHIYEVEMSLKNPGQRSAQLPARWLKLEPLERFFRLWQDKENYDFNIDVGPSSQEYFSSQGSHAEDSEILADPRQVLLRVVRQIF